MLLSAAAASVPHLAGEGLRGRLGSERKQLPPVSCSGWEGGGGGGDPQGIEEYKVTDLILKPAEGGGGGAHK